MDVASGGLVTALVQIASGLGAISGVIQAAGVSPSQAPPEVILAVDLYGTALLLNLFGETVAPAGRPSSSPRCPATACPH